MGKRYAPVVNIRPHDGHVASENLPGKVNPWRIVNRGDNDPAFEETRSRESARRKACETNPLAQ